MTLLVIPRFGGELEPLQVLHGHRRRHLYAGQILVSILVTLLPLNKMPDENYHTYPSPLLPPPSSLLHQTPAPACEASEGDSSHARECHLQVLPQSTRSQTGNTVKLNPACPGRVSSYPWTPFLWSQFTTHELEVKTHTCPSASSFLLSVLSLISPSPRPNPNDSSQPTAPRFSPSPVPHTAPNGPLHV